MNGSYEFMPETQNISPKREFSLAECLFAWTCFIGGYLFIKVLPIAHSPMGGFILTLLSFAAATAVILNKGIKIKALPIASALSAIAISFAMLLSSNGFLHSLSLLYSVLVFCYYIYSATGNCIKSGFTDLIAMDLLKALFVLPFCSFGELFRAMFSGKAKNSGKTIGKLLLGVFLALVPTAVVILLLSYDDGFISLVEKIFNFEITEVISNFFKFLLGIPVAMYVFGLFVSSVDRKSRDSITEESCIKASKQIKFVPSLTAVAAVSPMLFVYAVFFISQWQYYLSAFTGVLPESLSYADYAREGFFQLLAVSVINLVTILAVIAFMKRKEEKPSLLLKLISVTYSLFTLILITTAFSKLVLYIQNYGLTQRRVYAAWFMAVIAVIFIIILLKQFLPKLNAVALSVAAFVFLFAALSAVNADRLIAKYNVDCYLNGSLQEVDVGHLFELGDAAVPETVRLYRELDSHPDLPDAALVKKETEARLRALKNDRFEENEPGFFGKTVPYYIAQASLEKASLPEE